MTKRKKVRKPKDFYVGSGNHLLVFSCGYGTNLKEAKKLHAWLGRPLIYLEQEKEK